MNNPSIVQTIQTRSSWRTFQRNPLEAQLLKEIEQMIATKIPGPFERATRFQLLFAEGENQTALQGLRTYGFIKGASAFVAGAVEQGQYDLEEYGYQLEYRILKLTQMGLQTCWLGGTFSQSKFAARIQLQKGEVLPAITPLGIALEKRRTFDQVVRKVAQSAQRRDWEELFFNTDLEPLTPEMAGDFSDALEALRLAPSSNNKQPWRVVMDQGRLHFYLWRKGKQPAASKPDLPRVDMGIALCHCDLVLQDQGTQGKWVHLREAVPQGEILGEYLISLDLAT